ncbi:MAG: DNA repair protein RadA [Candidatus Omnitrophota bacterium]|nr:MAG: DNA repair protein RadA [Candidatus Omnitrophota bacterium]
MFICNSCGYKSVKWLGRCPMCGSWESFSEEKEVVSPELDKPSSSPVSLGQSEVLKRERIPTGIKELDKVLGGGLIRGEVVLVGGPPGVGKSTLLLEVSSHLTSKGKVLYVSAEESIEQINLRADRLRIFSDNLYLVNEDNLEEIYRHLKQGDFRFLVVDSIQVVYHPKISSPKGSVSQVKGCADFFVQIAKNEGIPVLIIGHVTKEGTIAGPKLLEHLVDCVLYFESETISTYRILRAVKNRFGPAGELAFFEMTSSGLKELANLADLFLPEKDRSIAGSCIVCVIEGIRPITLEIQALVSRASFGMVRRRSLGFDFNRFSLLVAIIEKRVKISLSSEDVFLNVGGGIKINDPAADLGACIAIISSYKDKIVPFSYVFLGEVGLAGEVRAVTNINLRLKELERSKLFKKVFVPQTNVREVEKKNYRGIKIEEVTSLKEVLDRIW